MAYCDVEILTQLTGVFQFLLAVAFALQILYRFGLNICDSELCDDAINRLHYLKKEEVLDNNEENTT